MLRTMQNRGNTGQVEIILSKYNFCSNASKANADKDGLWNHLIKIFNKIDADKGWAEKARKY